MSGGPVGRSPLRVAANLSMLFTEYPLLERPGRAAEAGFAAAELWWPFAAPVPGDRDVDALCAAFTDAGIRLVGLNFYAGAMADGDRGVVSDPRRAPAFRDNVAVTVAIAARLGCRVLNALYGNRVDGVPPAEQDDLALANLAAAAAAAETTGATVVLEALNARENPRYALRTIADVRGVLDGLRAAGARNTGVLADAYHLAMEGEDPAAAVAGHTEAIAHVQVADSPGRGAPGTGRVDFGALFAALASGGYQGWIGLEYRPGGPTEESLGWLEGHLAEGGPE